MEDAFEPAFQRRMLNVLTASGHKLALYKDNGGTELTEAGYARQPVTFFVTSIPPILARNGVVVTFGPANSAWPTVTHVGLFDSAGVLQFKRKLLVPVTKALGETLSVPIGSLEVGYA